MPAADLPRVSTATPPNALRHRLRVLSVIASAEFKLKYTGSALGYAWSVLKPLALFTLLYLVFGRVFNLNELSPVLRRLAARRHRPVHVLRRRDDARADLDRRAGRADPEDLLSHGSSSPTSVTLTAAMTLLINLTVVAGFLAYKQITPQPDWLLIPLLLVELYVYTLGVSLLLAALFVRLRDLQQVWELALQLFFYASPIIYPIGFLPPGPRSWCS